ncbi:MAG: stage III sporulation protein AE [Clostridiales bacterium]|jgi:stage III sporulation protein AE|nr:stage III sporulation protein AE [Clostridiales bacterium]
MNTVSNVDVQTYIDQQLELFDFSRLNKAAGLNFGEWVRKAISGELDLSLAGIGKKILDLLFGEILLNWELLRNLIIIAILSAVLKVLTDSFKSKAAAELGFFVSYISLLMVLIASFHTTLGIMTGLVTVLSNIMTAALPVMLGMLVLSGKFASASAFNPIFIVMLEGLSLFVRLILTPALSAGAMIEAINYLSNKPMLTNLTKLIRKVCDWGLKGVAFVFLSILSIQKISAPIINNTALKAAKAGAGAIPVVGDMVSGAMDVVLFWGTAASSGIMIALVITIIVVCGVQLIKILAMLLIYKLTAAVIQPIVEERFVKCIDGIAAFCNLIFQAGVTVVVMFIISVVIMLSF